MYRSETIINVCICICISKSRMLIGTRLLTLWPITSQMCSIEFKSVDRDGHGSTFIRLAWRRALVKRAVFEGAPSCINLVLPLFCRWDMPTGVRISFEYLKAFRLPLTTTHCVFIIFVTFKITPRMIKMLYLHILRADSTENSNAFCKLIVLDNYTISRESKKSVLRYIENITGSVGNFDKCTTQMLQAFAFIILKHRAVYDILK